MSDNSFRRARTEALKSARQLTVDGRNWVVYELPAYDHRGPALIFESDSIVRRVGGFPANWRELSDAALDDVSKGR